jgi:hypothetical protein
MREPEKPAVGVNEHQAYLITCSSTHRPAKPTIPPSNFNPKISHNLDFLFFSSAINYIGGDEHASKRQMQGPPLVKQSGGHAEMSWHNLTTLEGQFEASDPTR